MKFMLNWCVHEDKRHDAAKAFSQMTAEDDKADLGENLKLLGRWHDMVGFTGVAIYETDDPQARSSRAAICISQASQCPQGN